MQLPAACATIRGREQGGVHMKRCVIVAGGAYAPIGAREEGDFLIACDSGLRWCQKEGIVPDLLLGDFDSYEGALPDGVPVLRFPVRKDDTDAMLAVRWAVENGFEEVLLLCALGGSLDHLLANLQTLHFASGAGLRAAARDERTELLVLRPGSYRFPARRGWKFSVLALTDRVAGLSVRGAKYEVTDAELTNAFPLGVGNDFDGDITLRFLSGTAAVLLCDRRE